MSGPVAFNDDTPQGMAFHAEQAMVDADIEGLADDLGAKALIVEMEKLGVSLDEQVVRLARYFRDIATVIDAAE